MSTPTETPLPSAAWVTRLFKRYRDALDDICEACGDCGEEGCACLIAIRALEDSDE